MDWSPVCNSHDLAPGSRLAWIFYLAGDIPTITDWPDMDEPAPKDRFLQSLDRCSCQENFIPAFYDRFLAISDEIRDRFKHTDFKKQNQMLMRSLNLAAGATSGAPESLREIRERAETHDRHHLDIEPRLYDLWLTSVIDTAREFDTEWSESIEEAWKKILGHVIKHMIKYY